LQRQITISTAKYLLVSEAFFAQTIFFLKVRDQDPNK
jgi:hypothetical protein